MIKCLIISPESYPRGCFRDKICNISSGFWCNCPYVQCSYVANFFPTMLQKFGWLLGSLSEENLIPSLLQHNVFKQRENQQGCSDFPLVVVLEVLCPAEPPQGSQWHLGSLSHLTASKPSRKDTEKPSPKNTQLGADNSLWPLRSTVSIP